MVQPYAWIELRKSETSMRISGRSGHSLTRIRDSYICFGGSDGRKDVNGKTCPNNDLFVLSIADGTQEHIIDFVRIFIDHFKWSQPQASQTQHLARPPTRTCHSATPVALNKLFVFGGQHSFTPYRALNDAWLLDVDSFTWTQLMKPKSENIQNQLPARASRVDGKVLAPIQSSAQDKRPFHEKLISIVTSSVDDSLFPGITTHPAGTAPCPRYGHTCVAWGNDKIILFGGYGGFGYTRSQMNDIHVFDLETNQWSKEIVCTGTPPSGRTGHGSVLVGDSMFVFGGINAETQMNDLYVLDVLKMDWSDLDLTWSIPRWNLASLLIPALPNPKWFLFGGSVDDRGESTGRCFGSMDSRIGVLDIKPLGQMSWDEPVLEQRARPPVREGSAIVYDDKSSRLIVFGGWGKNRWLDDVWSINLSSVTGPPYAVYEASPCMGPVSGGTRVVLRGEGFKTTSTDSSCTVRITDCSTHQFFEVSTARVLSESLIQFTTPACLSFVDAQIRVRIGSLSDWTTTHANFKFYLNTIPGRSLCYGPGILEEGELGNETMFLIQTRNRLGENRTSGGDKIQVEIANNQSEILSTISDLGNGRYIVKYTPVLFPKESDKLTDILHLTISVRIEDDFGEMSHVRGSPFLASFIAKPKHKRLNLLSGPLVSLFIVKCLKEMDDIVKKTEAEVVSTTSDVHSLIRVSNQIREFYRQEALMELLHDQVAETLHALEAEGTVNEKASKQLRKTVENISHVREKCKLKEAELTPLIETESARYKILMIEEFERKILQNLAEEIHASPMYFFVTGVENSRYLIREFDRRLGVMSDQLKEYEKIASAFGYLEILDGSRNLISQCLAEIKAITSLWDHVFERSNACKNFASQLLLGSGETSVRPDEMEDAIKTFMKNLRESVKVDKEKDCYVSEMSLLKKWTQLTPLLFDLRDPAMRDRHWKKISNFLPSDNFTSPRPIPSPSVLTIGDLWRRELYRFSDQVGEIADQAKQEFKMEKFLTKLDNFWSVLEFTFTPHRNEVSVFTLKLSDDDFEQLEDHQVQVQNMFASRFFSTFETEITGWQKKLANVNEVATLLAETVRSWTFLENLFVYSEEVKKELPEDSERFKLIDKEIRSILSFGYNTNRICLNFCNSDGMYERLEKCMRMLSVCEKSLNEFMDGKRRAFPRFYFVSMVDLLDILSNGNSPHKVMGHMSKIFQAVKTFRLETGDHDQRPKAIGIESCINDEYVPFPNPLPLEGKVEIYLDKTITATREALRHYSKQTLIQYTEQSIRTKWLEDSPVAQCAILVNLISWVSRVEKSFAGGRQSLIEARDDSNRMLLDLIRMTQRTDLDKGTRQKLMCLITLDAHNRDVQEKLINENVSSAEAFQWQAQLKAYWDDTADTAVLKIADAQFHYGYEYLGNGPRLVVTPLTDRIYVTCTQALHLGMGCAPAGPAGTGKTETTKDLANALGKACFVFNSSPEVDYKSMGDLFKGLASSGSFGCFDEFNRLIPEVLSVCSIQFKAICDAIRSKADRFLLQGDEISLDRTCGVFITMNPGYLGRSTLPESLSSLFRPVTVMVADYNLIISNCLMSEGFLESDKLAKKFSTLYALCSDLLSKAKQYDWGMRAIKSVLVVAGGFKRADPSLSEEAVLMRALRDTNIAKIDGDDFKIFMGLLTDLFPGVNVPRARDIPFEQVIAETVAEMGYTNDEYLMLKITQLNELLSIRHCIFMMGNPGSFKSAVWRILAKAKEKIGEKVIWTDINPKAISTQELYGYVNMATREWKDGILSKTMRNFANDPTPNPKWIILDGDLDANWIESMNSVMDDNKLLTLPSNERISLKPNMRLIFEIRDLNFATPATVTRAGVVNMIDYNGVQWRCFKSSWISKKRRKGVVNGVSEDGEANTVKQNQPLWPENILNTLSSCFDKFCPEVLLYLKKFCKIQIPIVDIAIVQSLCVMLDSVLGPKLDLLTDQLAESVFILCLIWSAGGCLGEVDGLDYRKNFSNWWRTSSDITKMNPAIKFPTVLRSGSPASIFDFFVNIDAGGRLEEWSSIVPSINYSSDTPMSLITIPTAETVANSYFGKALMQVAYPVMFIGPSGCGKTQQCRGILESFRSHNINMNYYTDSGLLQSMMEAPLEKKAGRLFAPPGTEKIVYFIDDLNMPALDPYNTQSAISLLRQYQDYGHWYDRSKISLKDIGNTQLLCSMNPSAGSFTIDQRLQRHFWTCSVSQPDINSLNTIFATYMRGHFERLPFKSAVTDSIATIIKSAMQLQASMTKTFRKTATNFHYEFNLRHMSGVFGGLLQVSPDTVTDAEKIVSLWVHESDRVYSDRLMTISDVKKYKGLVVETVKKNFGPISSKIVSQIENPFGIVYTSFSKGWDAVENLYDKITSNDRLSELVNDAMKEYNETFPVMDLVLFEDALKHVARISRIISRPSGHALLVGVGGSGRQSLTRLAAFITKSTIMSVVISSSYGLSDFRTDLQSMYTKAGIKDERVVFIFSDNQITNEKFLVYINDLLSTGDIADLYTNEEKDAIRNSVRSAAKSASLPDTPESLWQFFINRIRKNLHMCLCFSPVGDSMRTWARKFPALVNCTVIDWFHAWPKEALKSVASKYIDGMDLGVFGNSVDVQRTLIDFIPYSFEVASGLSEKFTAEEKKFAYTTPKSFLELLKLYRKTLVAKQEFLRGKRDRLTRGLTKLRTTQEQVSRLETELTEKAVVVEEKAKAAEIFAERVGAEKLIVNAEAEKAAIEKANCEEIAAIVSAQQRSCEEDLSKAIPLVQKAEAALDVLNKKDFQELKSFAKPPPGVDKVCEACMYLLAGFDPSIEVDKRGKLKDPNWKGSQKMMSNPEKFLENLKAFKGHVDASRVPQMNIESARPLTLEPDFTVESMTKKSKAAAGLCEWVLNIVMYFDVYQSVEPKKQALREATAKLDSANSKLAEVQALVFDLEEKLAKLVADFDAAIYEKNAVIAEADKCKLKLNLAKRLIGALGANGGIWESSIAFISEELVRLPGDVALACCFVCYSAVFDRKYREQCMHQMIEYFRAKKIVFSEPFDVLKILANEADIARWQNEGLPSDRVSCENGAIINTSQRWCLLIDPQLQGITWIKNRYSSNLVVLRMNMPANKLMTEFEKAIEGGKIVLIENMGESIDAFLQPIISRNVIKRGRNKYMKLGEKEILYNSNFRLIMHTKLANPHYPPEIHAECTVINFTVTEKGLEEQLLFLVVKLERPELARQKLDLINSQNEFKVKLIELESLLLEKLANAQGNILEDTELIESLENAKLTSDEVIEKVSISKKTEIEINSVSDIYRPCADRASLLFFYLNDLRRIHPFYKYSLEGFVQVVTRAINTTRSRPLSSIGGTSARRSVAGSGGPASSRSGSVGSRRPQSDDGDGASSVHDFGSVNGDEESGSISGRLDAQSTSELSVQDIEQRVELLTKSITRQVFSFLSRGLFDQHKLTAASILCLRILARTGTVSTAEVDALIRCVPKIATVPDNLKSWISDTVWGQLKTLESSISNVFKNLSQNIESETLSWKRWFGEERIESVDLPRAFREISQFHKLILIRILRPDRLFACLTSFVSSKMGSEFIDRVPLDIDRAYMESSPSNPLFFVLFPGTDPTPMVENLGRRMGVVGSGKFINISMGQGQETVAINALNNCAKEGGWIMLQNIHLMQSWLKILEQSLESVEGTAHPEFRCILTSEPPAVVPGGFAQTIPDSILQKSIKIADEAPSDIKSNLRRAWGRFSQAMIDSSAKKKELKACLFALCFFHSVVIGRRKFGPQGWSRNYPFSDGDLTICASVLQNYLEKYDSVPWSDIRYIFGEIMYGGHVTDQWDMRVTNTYLSQLIVPELLGNTSMILAPGVRSPDSSKMEFNAYIKFIDERLPNEAPQLFGMHSNSEIRFLTNQSNTVLDTIQAIAGGGTTGHSQGASGNSSSSIQQLITLYLNLLPKTFDMLAIRSRITEWNPYIIVALQESERMNALLGEIRRSLVELEMGLSGALNMSDKMEDLMKSLSLNKVHGTWEKLAYPSLKPLSAWMNDLCQRAAQLNEWTSSLKTPKSVWVSGLFNPMSYLTAVMQVTARQHGLPLDQMILRCVLTNHRDPRAPDLAPATNGVYIHGLFMEGAAWEDGKGDEEGYIADSKPKVIHPVVPVMNVIAIPVSEMTWENMYKCPVYITSSRGATYIFTANVRMEPDDHASKWILSGAALLLTDD